MFRQSVLLVLPILAVFQGFHATRGAALLTALQGFRQRGTCCGSRVTLPIHAVFQDFYTARSSTTGSTSGFQTARYCGYVQACGSETLTHCQKRCTSQQYGMLKHPDIMIPPETQEYETLKTPEILNWECKQHEQPKSTPNTRSGLNMSSTRSRDT